MENKIQELPLHGWLSETHLLFHPDRLEDRDNHPLRGLINYGPYSRSVLNYVMDPIRIATITPAGESDKLQYLLNELESRHIPQERKQYLPEFLGFSRIFGIKAVLASISSQLALPSQLDKELSSSQRPHITLAEFLARGINALQPLRSHYDVVFIYLPTRWLDFFENRSETEEFDLHDYLKAVSAEKGIPIQLIREDRALSYPCRCSVMWRLGLALYCKAGGVPWKISDAPLDTAFIGLSYSIRSFKGRNPGFITCCSQVFDADGTGLEFLLYETGDFRVEGESPYLSRSEMRRVMARSLALYQRRHAGRSPRQVIIHKTSEFKPEEVDGCYDVLQTAEDLELLQIQQDVPWRGIKLEAPRLKIGRKGVPTGYPCDRGTYLQLGSRQVLLWTQGNASSVVRTGNFYKEGKGIPSPILVKRFAGHSEWAEQCRYILGLTKMNWNNDSLYDKLPVTLGYASILARTIKRMSHLAPQPYQLRFFM